MSKIFPEVIKNLPEADIPLDGITAFLSQGDQHQIIFMEFEKDVDLPEHEHESQYGIVLEGKIELTIDGVKNTFVKGDRYYIPSGVKHFGKIFAGYADMTFFNEKDRYSKK
ncbi:cupin domain-containing protein [Geosporobacter ferrireducens]|uniref:Cupin n=1 Tax=Geosporobacter ferrireducens TaxID=1424294 RepID=A0A1D8GN76_9FIRM|nr:cupin domain-containing protein [Geosporobacter ferrireducens]AOT72327.1 cupin [Geosporobacter ferrireducens]MTI56418.1 cupin domain-containing protein [Geosporobacter ferrireducens]